jgi:AcrR family transcriptional regulator
MKIKRRSLFLMSIAQDTTQSDDPDQSLQSNTGLLTRKAGRPRSTSAHKAILNATLELFADEGFNAMSIEAIAARAGVGKTTIYRRWDSKEDLVLDAARSLRAEFPFVDTGNLRDDLLHLLKLVWDMSGKNSLLEKLWVRIIGESRANPDLFRLFYERGLVLRLQHFRQVIEQAQARGEIRKDLEPFLVLDLIMGPLISRLLLTGPLASAPHPGNFPEQMVDVVLQGLALKPTP